VSDRGPLDPENDPFRNIPLFGDLARMLQQQGPVSWDAARQLAASIATEGVSEPNIERARKFCPRCQLYDGRKLPFGDGFFDAAGALNVLEHVEEPEAFIKELVRVVRIGGRVVISSPNFFRVLGFRDYHPKMRGLGNKLRNWQRLREKRHQMQTSPEAVRFDRMTPIVKEPFTPDDDAIVATREVTLRQGLTPVVLEGQIDSAGSHVLSASLTVANDPLAANNTLEVAAEVMPRARVLYVEGAPQSARYLTGAHRRGQMKVAALAYNFSSRYGSAERGGGWNWRNWSRDRLLLIHGEGAARSADGGAADEDGGCTAAPPPCFAWSPSP